jgi:DNA-binding NarL/FixJ family response regulator
MGRRVRVVIADDQPEARQGLKAVLAAAGLARPGAANGTSPEIEVVGVAADGWEAVQLVERTRPDAVLMDVQMPGLDGLEATRRVKAGWPQVRVIVLTMYADRRAEALAAGADTVLLKGFPAERLLAAILETKG